MIRYGIVFLAAMGACVAIAEESPTPRPPIGPKTMELRGMLPDPRDPFSQKPQSVSENGIRVVNVGDQQLFIAYWDGDSAWQQRMIDAGRSTEILCVKCGGAITVRYHDGKQDRSVKAKTGGTYFLGWSAQAGAWVFTSSAASR